MKSKQPTMNASEVADVLQDYFATATRIKELQANQLECKAALIQYAIDNNLFDCFALNTAKLARRIL